MSKCKQCQDEDARRTFLLTELFLPEESSFLVTAAAGSLRALIAHIQQVRGDLETTKRAKAIGEQAIAKLIIGFPPPLKLALLDSIKRMGVVMRIDERCGHQPILSAVPETPPSPDVNEGHV